MCISTDCRTAWPSGGGGSGTVTSVTAGSGLTGGTITTSGTITVDQSASSPILNTSSTGQTKLGSLEVNGGIGTAGLRVDNNAVIMGNMGIGTNSPQYKLDVAGTFAATAVNSKLGLFTSGANVFLKTRPGGIMAFLDGSGNDSSGDSNMFIDGATGNVGIGTNSPMATLDVGGPLPSGANARARIRGELQAGSVSAGKL